MEHLHPIAPSDHTGATPVMDDEGYLIDPAQWNRELASQLAEAADLPPLGEVHWDIIDYVRGKYLTLGALPPMRRVCRHGGIRRHQIKQLFGGCRQLWRIAGLPNPGEEAKTYMD